MNHPGQGIILLAHGARDPAWSAPFEAVAARVRAARPDLALRLAFLEFMAPGLADAGAALAAAGCTSVEIVPLFLGMGGHVRKDVPHQVDALRAAHPAIGWHLHPAAGEADRVVVALAETALAAARPPFAVPP